MDHPKCATCKHFSDAGFAFPNGFGVCNLMAETWDMTEYKKVDGWTTRVLKPEFSDHLAGLEDGGTPTTDFYPSPDFYCPMHSDLMPQLKERSS